MATSMEWNVEVTVHDGSKFSSKVCHFLTVSLLNWPKEQTSVKTRPDIIDRSCIEKQ